MRCVIAWQLGATVREAKRRYLKVFYDRFQIRRAEWSRHGTDSRQGSLSRCLDVRSPLSALVHKGRLLLRWVTQDFEPTLPRFFVCRSSTFSPVYGWILHPAVPFRAVSIMARTHARRIEIRGSQRSQICAWPRSIYTAVFPGFPRLLRTDGCFLL